MISEKTLDLLNDDLDGLCVQFKQMTELARLEGREEYNLYKNILKVIQRDLDAILMDADKE